VFSRYFNFQARRTAKFRPSAKQKYLKKKNKNKKKPFKNKKITNK
jgi:hypothetical protein